MGWRLQEEHPKSVSIRAFALPDEESLSKWISQVQREFVSRLDSSTSLLVFRNQEYLGNQIDVLLASASPVQKKAAQEVVREPPPLLASSTNAPLVKEDVLPIQLVLKSHIVTGFRVSEKPFTNYKPLASYLVSQGWQFLLQAPLPAGLILVQDQTSASAAMQKYPRALINNIGWGGQSCLGGTKGTQLECRQNKAAIDGCDYESLEIQPPHIRMWNDAECSLFFQEKCQEDKLYILKPSGGQHGQGIKVHQGCQTLRTQFPQCPTNGEEKKYFVSPYLTPALLIDGYKFDVRTFALIASLDPLLCFYSDGFIRKATTLYSTSNLNNAAAHVTNSLSQDLSQDHFWSFSKLDAHFQSTMPHLVSQFRLRAKKVTEFFFQAASQVGFKKVKGRFQLFAADWILDGKGKPFLLEVNSNPLMSSQPPKGLETIFPLFWHRLMDLVLDIHTGEKEQFKLKELIPYKFERANWHLVLNQDMFPVYNTCQALAPSTTPSIALPCANPVQLDSRKLRCTLAPNTEDETTYYIIPASDTVNPSPPVVVIVAGMHGNEGAGILAARHVAANWQSPTSTLIVLERANARGVASNLRFVPPSSTEPGFDLNRAFSADSFDKHILVKSIWDLLHDVKPDYYFDLHEGRAHFALSLGGSVALPQTEILNNVGATTGGSVSKGNSVVTSLNAYDLAQHVANQVNLGIAEVNKKLFVMGPPIRGGLASMLSQSFPLAKVMLFETTLGPPVEMRAKQHLTMLSLALKKEGLLSDSFDPLQGKPLESCVVTRKGCLLPVDGVAAIVQ